jgi:hypothetical protein
MFCIHNFSSNKYENYEDTMNWPSVETRIRDACRDGGRKE